MSGEAELRNNNVYIVKLIWNKRFYFILWENGKNEPDKYLMEPKLDFIISSRTRAKLDAVATEYEIKVVDQEPAVVNLDAMKLALKHLRYNKSISQKISTLLLNSWNTLDDLLFSIECDASAMEVNRKLKLDIIYDKLFHGNNLPAINKSKFLFSPKFSRNEIHIFRKTIREKLKLANKFLR